MKKLILIASFLILGSSPAFAMEEGQSAFGVQAGQVTLSGDVGTFYNGALGWGAFYQYATTDHLTFELSYAYSKHTGVANSLPLNMTQHSITGDMLYVFNYFLEFFPYLKGGVDFVIHSPQDVPGVGFNTSYGSLSGFGLNLGLGGEYLLTENTTVGLDMTFHNMFDVAVIAVGNPNAKAIQNYSTVMARFAYHFGSEKKSSVAAE